MTTAPRRPVAQAVFDVAPAFVLHPSVGTATCRHCGHVIRRYREVGWVDTTPAVYGGCYDMCSASLSGQHEPR